MNVPNYNDAIRYGLDIVPNGHCMDHEKKVFSPKISTTIKVWATPDASYQEYPVYHFYDCGTNDLRIVIEDSKGSYKNLTVENIHIGHLYPILWKILIQLPRKDYIYNGEVQTLKFNDYE